MAELNKETARLSAEAEEAKRQIAEANARQAAAEQRAAELNLYIERLTEWRIISSDAARALSDGLAQFVGTPFVIAVVAGDPESDALAQQIEAVLEQAGWIEASWKGVVVLTREQKPTWGLITGTGVVLRTHPTTESRFRSAISALIAGLNAASILAGQIPVGSDEPNQNVVQVLVAKKPAPARP